ncbi:lipid A-modifier LpxR family protein [Croceiramulus getboli]|nr:lipid A deacylase LpxR family protein [Flavobacteriaceae bacterium YJPT1-3]
MRLRYLIIFFWIGITAGAQQASVVDKQLGFQHDNDLYFLSDQYYSQGTFFHFTHQLKKNFIFTHDEDFPLELTYVLGHETHTPSEIKEEDIDDIDRPYAGWTFVSARLSKPSALHLWQFQTELGVTGEWSGARVLQQWYHDLIGSRDPTWITQIENAVLFNLKTRYIKEFSTRSQPDRPFLGLLTELSLGNKDLYVEQGLQLFVGERQNTAHSMRYGRIGNGVNELFGVFGASYRYVIHNALLEGDWFQDPEVFTVTPNESLLHFTAGINHRHKRNHYRVVLHLLTQETAIQDGHAYLQVAYALNF